MRARLRATLALVAIALSAGCASSGRPLEGGGPFTQAGAGTSGSRASAGAGNPNTAAGGGYHNGLQVFTMAEGGLMYQATIAGQRYNFEAVE